LLSKNVPDAKVAFILGHKGTEMIYRHYGHLDATSKTIAEELDRTLNGDAGTPAGPAA
jgi:intergrase/recombinase